MAWLCPPPEDKVRKVLFSCPKLDENIGMSVRAGNIIEISGEAGSAKTQFCHHLALQTVSVRELKSDCKLMIDHRIHQRKNFI